jgi:hypothetical protein
MTTTIIKFDNYKEHLNKPVEVIIGCYEAGFAYHDDNILKGMDEDTYYFYSPELDLEWSIDFEEEDGNLSYSVEVFLKEEEDEKH